jgi:ribonuclease HI
MKKIISHSSDYDVCRVIWVQGHEGITGNKTADHLARTGPEPACGISFGVAKIAVKDWMNKKHQTIGIHKGTQTGKGTNTRTLCQKIC